MEQPGAEHTVEHLFELAVKIEHQASLLYETFSKMFSHFPELDDFWRTMIDEESAHERLLQDARDLLSPAQLQAPADDRMMRDATRVRRLFADDLNETIQTLDDAYELMHNLEYSEMNAIFQFLSSKWIPPSKQHNLIHGVIEKHLEYLSSFGDKFGDKDWRKAIKKKDLVD
jgi:hypothetical protein